MSEMRVEGVLWCPDCKRYLDIDTTPGELIHFAAAHALPHAEQAVQAAKD